MTEVDLSGLKEIHLPIEPSWWPPALGWWLVLMGSIIFIMLLIGMFFYWYTTPKQYALRALKYYYKTDTGAILLARHMSALMKRISILEFPKSKVAKLTDDEWIDFLLEKTGNSFSEKQLQLLATATYMPEQSLTPNNLNDLYSAGKQAIQKLFERKKNGSESKKHS